MSDWKPSTLYTQGLDDTLRPIAFEIVGALGGAVATVWVTQGREERGRGQGPTAAEGTCYARSTASHREVGEDQSPDRHQAHRPGSHQGGYVVTDLPDTNPKTELRHPEASPWRSYPWLPLRRLLARTRWARISTGPGTGGSTQWLRASTSTPSCVTSRRGRRWSDNDPESGVCHLGHIMACCGILLDAQAQGKLVDDRPLRAKRKERVR